MSRTVGILLAVAALLLLGSCAACSVTDHVAGIVDDGPVFVLWADTNWGWVGRVAFVIAVGLILAAIKLQNSETIER